ncbi:MAG: T9SS type A sorting domain-containing protein [Saprospiraceae bacterium]
MKQILLSAFITAMAWHQGTAQIVLDAAEYFPVAGDTLRIATDNTPSAAIAITPAGGEQTWDFSMLQSDFVQERLVRPASEGEAAATYPTANILFDQAAGGEGYYLSNANAFSIVGYAGTDPLGLGFQVSAPFTPAYVERWAPLQFFDLHTHNAALTIALATEDIPGNLFDGLPIAPDSIRVRVNTARTDLVDAWGTLTIPGGTFDVLREKRTEFRNVRLEAKVGIFPWQDITDLALAGLPIDQLGADTLVTYSFWGEQVKEPIVVINADPTGTTVETVDYKHIEIVSAATVLNKREPAVNVYPNPAIVQAKFEFANFADGIYTIELYNLTGRPVLRKEVHVMDHQVEKIGVAHLPKGIYLYAIMNSKGQRLAVNRLVVMKP